MLVRGATGVSVVNLNYMAEADHTTSKENRNITTRVHISRDVFCHFDEDQVLEACL